MYAIRSYYAGEATFVHADVTNRDEVASLVEMTIDLYQQLDIAVNNAGYGGVRARTAEYPEEEWRNNFV